MCLLFNNLFLMGIFDVLEFGGGGVEEILVVVEVRDFKSLEVFIELYIRNIIVSVSVVIISFFFFWEKLLFEVVIFMKYKIVFKEVGGVF